MPNHFHLALWPRQDGDLGRWMHWLSKAHVRCYHRHYHSGGHLWQRRFKALPIQQDDHLLTVLRYVERNPVRAGLVERGGHWPWSGARFWRDGGQRPAYLHVGPVDRGPDWLGYLNQPLTEPGLAALRTSVNRGRPYGSLPWVEATARDLGLQASLRPRGRPRQARPEGLLPIADT
jgi:putative transposase